MLNSSKLKKLSNINTAVNKHRNNTKKIILAHGVFDLLHVGHIRHLEQ